MALVRRMMDLLHGARGLAQAWNQAIDTAKAKGRDYAVLRSLLGFFEVWLAVRQLQPTMEEEMTEEEWLRMRKNAVRSLAREDPGLLIEVGRAEGWRFEAPGAGNGSFAPDLAALIGVWPTLPTATKAGIVEMIRAVAV